MNQTRVVLVQLLLSAIGAGTLLVASFISSPLDRALSSADRLMVGSVFMAFCAFGIISSLKLVRWGGRDAAARTTADGEGTRRRVGHHPDCDRFESHVVHMGRMSMCGGCLGLALGSSVALACMAFYLAEESSIPPGYGPGLVLCGVILVLIAFVETGVHARTVKIHVLANALLVMGFFLVVVGVPSATGSGIAGLFTILIALLFMDTRVRISEWKHADICRKCGRSCRSY